MATKATEVKWIAIAIGLFDDEKIMLIESMPEGDTILVIWLKLLLLAGKCNDDGILILNNRMAFTDEMLATVFRRPLNTVRMALQAFEDLGMIDVIEGTVTIPNWSKYQEVRSLEQIRANNAERQKRFRERQKLKALGMPESDTESEENDGRNVTDNATDNVTNNVSVTPRVTPICNNNNKYNNNNNKNIDIYDGGPSATEPAVSGDTDLSISDSDEKKSKKPTRHRYGEYKHVMLTDEQYQNLTDEHGEQVVGEAIRVVDEYCERSGRRYKNYYLVIKDWGIDRAQQNIRKAGRPGSKSGSGNPFLDMLQEGRC